ncbi:hypothetical protein D3C81_1710040 [compost metagenome]
MKYPDRLVIELVDGFIVVGGLIGYKSAAEGIFILPGQILENILQPCKLPGSEQDLIFARVIAHILNEAMSYGHEISFLVIALQV